ncbi:MAG: TIM barrel protein [Devosia sp.]|nr:TIM barrel protein [Devosia sp.]
MPDIEARPGRGALPATLCFSTLGCGELDLEDVLTLAVRRAIPAVELRTLGGRNELPQYFEARYGTPERLRNSLAGFGVRIVSLDSSCQAIGSTRSDWSELVALTPWALAVGARGIRVFDGGERGDSAELASVRPMLEWWRGRGLLLELLIETHDALARPAALQAFIERYPGASILWDTHHTWTEGAEDPATTWARVRGRAGHLHVKDSVAQQGYVPPGEGAFPFGDLIAALRRDAFAGVISLEWERHWFPELPPIDAALDGLERVFSRHLTKRTTS